MVAVKKFRGRSSGPPKRAPKRAIKYSGLKSIIKSYVAQAPRAQTKRHRRLPIKTEREEDGRWIGEVPDLPGVLAYGETEAEARVKATALALHVIADRIEHGDPVPTEVSSLFVPAA